ncbi:hypothetical protein PT2222_40239 [Paraburkholderia tropica]
MYARNPYDRRGFNVPCRAWRADPTPPGIDSAMDLRRTIERATMRAGAEIDLQRHVRHAKALAERRDDRIERGVARMAGGHDEMRGQRGAGGRERPDVQVVYVGHALLLCEKDANTLDVDALRHRREREPHRLAQQAPRTVDDHADDRDAHQRIDAGPARRENHEAAHGDGGGYGGVGGHVQEGAANVQIVGPAAHEQPRRKAVDEDAEGRDHEDIEARDAGRMQEPPHRFGENRAAGHEQQRGVGERRENRRAAQAERKARGRRARSEPGRAPGEQQAEHVGEIVARVGEQRGGMREHAVDGLRDHDHDVQRDGQCECAMLARRGCGVVGVVVSVRVAAVIVMIVAVVVVVIVRTLAWGTHRPRS